MVAPDLLRDGILAGCSFDSRCDLSRGGRRPVFHPTLHGRSLLVVEIVLELRQCRRIPLPLQPLVFVVQAGSGWGAIGDGLPHLHGNDIGLLCPLLRCHRFPDVLLVQQDGLRSPQVCLTSPILSMVPLKGFQK